MQTVTADLAWLQTVDVPLIKGNFDQVHPAKFFVGLFKAGKTGVLVVDDSVVKQNLFFHNGCLVFYQPGVFEDKGFARHLQLQGVLAEDEYLAYRKLAEKNGTNPINLLIEKQILDGDFVGKVAELFYRKNASNIFSWRNGAYTFYETDLPNCQPEIHSKQTLRWIIDGVREHYFHGMIEQRLQKRMKTPLKPAADAPVKLEALAKNENERKIIDWIKQGSTINAIMAESELGASNARAYIFALLIIGECKFAAKTKRKKRQPKEVEPLPSDPLHALFKLAEKSVDRIKREVEYAKEHEIAAQPAEEEIPIEREELADELRKRLKDKLSKISAAKQKADEAETIAPDDAMAADAAETTQKKIGDTAKSAEEMGEIEIGDPFMGETLGEADEEPILEQDELEEIDRYAEQSAAEEQKSVTESETTYSEDQLAGPDAADVALGENGEVELGDLDFEVEDEETLLDPDGDARLDGLLDEDKPILFSEDDPPEHILQLGISLVEQELWSQALEVLKTAIDRGSDDPRAKVYLGLTLYRELEGDPNRFNQAVEWVQQGVSADPGLAVGYITLGKIYLEEGDRDMAELYMVKALEVDRDCVDAKEVIRQIYQER